MMRAVLVKGFSLLFSSLLCSDVDAGGNCIVAGATAMRCVLE